MTTIHLIAVECDSCGTAHQVVTNDPTFALAAVVEAGWLIELDPVADICPGCVLVRRRVAAGHDPYFPIESQKGA